MAFSYSTFQGWNIVPMPLSPAPRQIDFTAQDSVGMTQSPFTKQSQVQAWPGADWWELNVSLPPLTDQQARAWIAFLMALRGKANVFQIGDPLKRVPTLSGLSPVVNGAQLATATLLNTRGWPIPSSTNLVPDPDVVGTGWSNTANIYVAPGAGAVSGNGWVYYGTGASGSFQYAWSAPFAVTPGQQYTLSGYVDARNLLPGGAAGWAVFNPGITASYGSFTVPAGSTGQGSATFTVPAGVTQLVALCDNWANATALNKPVIFSNPKVELGATATPYVSPAVMRPGDYLQLGYRLHVVAGPIGVYPDGSGNATIEVWPSLRDAPTDGEAITLGNTAGLFRLADNKRDWSVTEAKLFGISFKAIEAR